MASETPYVDQPVIGRQQSTNDVGGGRRSFVVALTTNDRSRNVISAVRTPRIREWRVTELANVHLLAGVIKMLLPDLHICRWGGGEVAAFCQHARLDQPHFAQAAEAAKLKDTAVALLDEIGRVRVAGLIENVRRKYFLPKIINNPAIAAKFPSVNCLFATLAISGNDVSAD
ncbi:MAG: hypothetical protein Q7T86_07270 [Hyphomicrobiaceae bacterium]|nr:hypothetical protein [Hyphomicrobiaceae bacterium]